VLDGITFTDLMLEAFKWAAVAAAPVAAFIGLLRRSRLRSALIWGWAFLPLSVGIIIFIALPLLPAVFLAILLAIQLLPWAVFSALAFVAVLWLRDFSGSEGWIDR
jgi:hypothetical protein